MTNWSDTQQRLRSETVRPSWREGPQTVALDRLPPPSDLVQGWSEACTPGRAPRTRGAIAWPRITVITPSFDQGRYLEATLRSVLLQGYPNLEYLVVDGGSRDGSLEVLQRYSRFLSAWCSEPDDGQAHAINKGLARATGEVLGWLNSDDVLLPGSLFEIGRLFATRPEAMVAAAWRRPMAADGSLTGHWVRDLPTRRHLRQYCCVAQETVYWRRAVYEAVGGLDESKAFALDYEYWLRMLEAGYSFTQVPAFLGACRDHEATKRATRTDTWYRDLMAIYAAFDLGHNEEAVLMRGGPEWAARKGLIEDLAETKAFRNGRLALATLRLLEQPWFERHLVSTYLRYRVYRPPGIQHQPRWRALVRAMVGEVSGRPQPDRCEPHLLPSGPVQRARWPWAEARDDARAYDLPFDTLALGAGWSWLEHSNDVYRWGANEVEIVVLRPSGLRRVLELELESGPSLDWAPFEATLVDADDRVVDRIQVVGAPVAVALPLRRGSAACFRLRVPATAEPASADDPRILALRVTAMRWQGEPDLRDVITADRRTVPVAVEASDVVAAPVAALQGGRRRRRLPRDGWFLGAGWFPVAGEEATTCHRWGGDGSRLVVTRARGGRRTLTVDVEAAAHWGTQGCWLWLDDEQGRCLARTRLRGRSRLDLAFDLAEGRTQVLRLGVAPAEDGGSAVTGRDVCLWALGLK